MKIVTLYCPAGDGVEKHSHTVTYKDISDFTMNGNGTVSFKTQKGVAVLTPLFWRLKEGTKEQLAALEDVAPAAAPRAGNRAAENRW